MYNFEKEVRKASGRKELLCPDSDCQYPYLRYCHGEKYAYFAHLNNKGCDYANFDKKNTPIMRLIRGMIYEHFKLKGFNVRPEVKLLEHHYTHLLFDLINGNTIAVEIGTKSLSANHVDKLSAQYHQKGIAVKWIVIDNTKTKIYEEHTYFLKRYLLNESVNKDLLVISVDGTEVAQYKCDTNKYEYNGYCYHSKNYPEIFVERASLNALTFEGNELSLDGFMERYNMWLTKKHNAFTKKVASIKEQERLYSKDNNKQTRNGFNKIMIPIINYEQKISKKLPISMNSSYEERRNEVLPQLEQQISPVRDSLGIRWIKCEECGVVEDESKFNRYGGTNRINVGVCNKCNRSNR